MNEQKTVTVMGITCEVTRVKCLDGKYHNVYTYTVPGWERCSTTGIKDTRRVINARLSPGVRNLYGLN